MCCKATCNQSEKQNCWKRLHHVLLCVDTSIIGLISIDLIFKVLNFSVTFVILICTLGFHLGQTNFSLYIWYLEIYLIVTMIISSLTPISCRFITIRFCFVAISTPNRTFQASIPLNHSMQTDDCVNSTNALKAPFSAEV